MHASGGDMQLKSALAKSLGRKVYLARRAVPMSSWRLCKRAGIARSTLNHIEAGRKMPRLDTLCKLAQALKQPLDEWLVYLVLEPVHAEGRARPVPPLR